MRVSLGLLKEYITLTEQGVSRLAARNWSVNEKGQLTKRFALKSHSDIGLMSYEIAKVADKLRHHPEMNIKYRFVTILLRTNDVQQITKTDEELADLIDGIYQEMNHSEKKRDK